jgi:hypothetical protein
MNVALVNLKANMRMNVSINFHYGWMIFFIHLMYGWMFNLSLNFYEYFFLIILINYSFMKHNLILYKCIFGYGFKFHTIFKIILLLLNIHPMVIVIFKKFNQILFWWTNWPNVVDNNKFPFVIPKVPQLLSNLFISVVGNNGGFFHYLLTVPWFFSNLTNVVDNNGVLML